MRPSGSRMGEHDPVPEPVNGSPVSRVQDESGRLRGGPLRRLEVVDEAGPAGAGIADAIGIGQQRHVHAALAQVTDSGVAVGTGGPEFQRYRVGVVVVVPPAHMSLQGTAGCQRPRYLGLLIQTEWVP
jgi:hypothetical protein